MIKIPYSFEVKEKVKEQFEQKRKAAQDDADKRKAEVYVRVKGIEEIDKALAKTGLKVYSEAINKGSCVPLEERIAVLREENLELQRVRAELMEAAGYSADYTKPRYECDKCKDTGYVDLFPCECLITAFRRESYLSSGLGALLSDQNFDNFDISLYPESSRDVMQYNYNNIKLYAETFDSDTPNKNLLFCGGTGLGKTHLSTSVARTLIDRGFSVVYDTSINIMSVFERERFAKPGTEIVSERYFDCDLLIIDDLGSEVPNSFAHATLYNIINTRLNANKATLISTNLSEQKLRTVYDERIVSRLFGTYRVFMFRGDDIRLSKRKTNLDASKK